MPWLPWTPGSKPPSPPPASSTLPWDSDSLRKGRQEANALATSLYARASQLPPSLLIASSFALGGASALGGRYIHARFFRRLRNAGWVTPDMVKRKLRIKGYVTSVGDADGFRLYHTPGIGWRWPFKFRRIPDRTFLKTGETISVRMAGADAPELGHFGKQPQKYATEAQEWLKSRIDKQFIYCELLAKDQYGRIVAVPLVKSAFVPAWLSSGKSLSLEMVRLGWAEVYEQHGAVYGEAGIEKFKRAEKEAQDARRGMWAEGVQGVERPSDYKRRHRQDAEADKDKLDPESIVSPTPTLGSRFKKLFGLKS
ncbi:SNase-domain-containing protein [Epithele typhae]|uniref:SNase-domain-containing protein n=1 Tax=Epithele typhae TaxID=378194 RepID=UPI00200787F2|nr:SNase-domain-containing protein [Epithele typhae]KAH9925651.1 SNase-domain-containing protein [Epithele typhae]